MAWKSCNSKSRSGTVVLVLALGTVFFMAVLSLMVDLVYVYYVHSVLVTTVDACVLRGVRAIGRGGTEAEQQAEVTRAVQLLFQANLPDGFMGATSVTPGVPVLREGERAGTREVEFSAEVTLPAIFYRVFDDDDFRLSARARALRRDVNLMLVLDRSGSMAVATGSNPGP